MRSKSGNIVIFQDEDKHYEDSECETEQEVISSKIFGILISKFLANEQLEKYGNTQEIIDNIKSLLALDDKWDLDISIQQLEEVISFLRDKENLEAFEALVMNSNFLQSSGIGRDIRIKWLNNDTQEMLIKKILYNYYLSKYKSKEDRLTDYDLNDINHFSTGPLENQQKTWYMKNICFDDSGKKYYVNIKTGENIGGEFDEIGDLIDLVNKHVFTAKRDEKEAYVDMETGEVVSDWFDELPEIKGYAGSITIFYCLCIGDKKIPIKSLNPDSIKYKEFGGQEVAIMTREKVYVNTITGKIIDSSHQIRSDSKGWYLMVNKSGEDHKEYIVLAE